MEGDTIVNKAIQAILFIKHGKMKEQPIPDSLYLCPMKEAMEIAFDYDRQNLDDHTLLKLYENMLLPRMIEEKMLLLLRKVNGLPALDRKPYR
jgi:hypothetical protein